MKLCEHEEFDQAILQAARDAGLTEQFVEKDYYVTEILRIVAERYGEKAVFKGGTSLSKGWKLITRFSEDIDLFVRLPPKTSRRRIDLALKEMAGAISGHPALNVDPTQGNTSRGKARKDFFAYESRFSELPGIRAGVLLEPGVRSGTFPTMPVPLSSLVGEYLASRGAGDMADDLTGFEMTLLHFRRTFVEKLFAVHDRVLRLVQSGIPLAREARHYSDLYVLADREEVLGMLRSDEYATIYADCRAKSVEFFGDQSVPEGESLADSPALFPGVELRAQLERDYDTQCRLLFSGQDFAPFDQVLGRFEEIREYL